MKVFKCDICGNYYDPYEGKIDGYEVNAILIGNFDGLSSTDVEKRYDSCPNCLTAFSQFLYDRQHPREKKILDQERWREE